MIKFLIFIFIISPVVYSQTESLKWGKNEISYTLPVHEKRDYSLNDLSTGELLLKAPLFFYRYFISDVDGDNCPFHPSCSSFFVESAMQTNIFQGMLMFGDRFTRDTNFFKRNNYYPQFKHKLYDPPSLYTLSKEKVNSGLELIHRIK